MQSIEYHQDDIRTLRRRIEMNMIYNNIAELIGKTPIVELSKFSKNYDLKKPILAKLELLNPGGSVKDRIAKAMIDDAESEGALQRGMTIVEPTSGNTGIGLAMYSALKGYKIILVMPENMSIERQKLFKLYGAEVVLTSSSTGMKGAIEKAEELVDGINGFMPYQFKNASNPQAHYNTTALEIWEELGNSIDYIVAGVGTGGTISGIGKFYKEKGAATKFVAVEPVATPVLSTGKPGVGNKIQGIGAGFVPDTLDRSIISDIVVVDNDDAFKKARSIARSEGILVGISSGAALSAAIIIAQRAPEARVLAILPDTGERYLSGELASE